ncbi:hypothetical protein [Kineococcus radiotolerans]|uniref:hypothetical protein n=1 Tax=Kineococcus radiotolerans TaxID=131568 RepID=UPI0012FF3756|nr:hypothetical protein [Kineococcus radiotolerans]
MGPRRVVLAAAALTAALAGCGSPSGTADPEVVERHVASRSAPDVVRDYLDAVQDDDRATAAVLSTPGFAAQDVWQRDGAPDLDDVEVSDDTTSYDTGWSSEELQAYAQAVDVQATYRADDGGTGTAGGEPGWGYVLVRHSDQDPWLIASAGHG